MESRPRGGVDARSLRRAVVAHRALRRLGPRSRRGVGTSAAEGLARHRSRASLHGHALGAPRPGLLDVYRATDRSGDLVAATEASTVIVFSMGGMGPNRSDAASMVLLPELLLRWALDERRLEVPAEWASAPILPDALRRCRRVQWTHRAGSAACRPRPIRVRDRCDAGGGLTTVQRKPMRQARAVRRGAHRPPGHRDLDWQRPPGTPIAGRRCGRSLPSFDGGSRPASAAVRPISSTPLPTTQCATSTERAA